MIIKIMFRGLYYHILIGADVKPSEANSLDFGPLGRVSNADIPVARGVFAGDFLIRYY